MNVLSSGSPYGCFELRTSIYGCDSFLATMQDASSGAADRKFPRDQLYFQASIMAQWEKKGEYSEYIQNTSCVSVS